MPDFGLDEDGTTWIDYGPRKFKVTLDEALAPVLFDQEGKRLKSIPKPGKSDDADTAKAEKKRFGALKKDLRAVSKQQIERLEIAMCNGRAWAPEIFERYFVQHPLVRCLARRLIWSTGSTLFCVDESGQCIDTDFEPVELKENISLPHALNLTENDQTQWGEYLGDFELLQPLEQLARSTFDASQYKKKGKALTDIAIELPAPRWVFGIEKRGWARWDIIDGGGFYAHEKEGPDSQSAIVSFDGAVAVGYIEDKEQVKVTKLTFHKEGKDIAPKDADPIFVSECIRDIESLRP